MGTTNLPQSDPAGVTGNNTLKINNDYVYPRYTYPAMLRYTNTGGGTSIGSAPALGLMRGWIYPADVNQDLLKAQQIIDPEDRAKAIESLSDEARREAEAMIARQNAANIAPGIGLPESWSTFTPAGFTTRAKPPDDLKTAKKIRYNEGKQFQFNPASVDLQISFVASAPAESLQEGTAATTMVGNGRTTLEMLFDRTIEVAAATRGNNRVHGYVIDSIFKDIGVQKDIWDVYRIILGGDEDYFKAVGASLANIETVAGQTIQPGSGTDMFGRLFDVGMSGNQAYGRPVAVYYNPNLMIIGMVDAMSIIYAEFNASFVPTKAKMDIGIQVLSTTSESGTSNVTATDTTTTTTTPDTGPATPSSSSSPKPGTIVKAGMINGEQAYRIAGSNTMLMV